MPIWYPLCNLCKGISPWPRANQTLLIFLTHSAKKTAPPRGPGQSKGATLIFTIVIQLVLIFRSMLNRVFIFKKPLFVVLFTIFIDLVGFGILVPIIPVLLSDPTSKFYLLSASLSLEKGYLLLGLLIAVFPMAQFFAAPILGQLSDQFGRKKILFFSLIGTCFSYILFAIAIYFKNIPLLFFARAIDGFTGGNLAVAQAAVADITKPEDRSKNFGLIGGAFGLGFIVGPFLGGKLSDSSLIPWFDATTPFLFAALLTFVNIISLVILFPETNRQLFKNKKISWNQSVSNILKAFRMKELRVVYASVFLFSSGFTFYTTFFAVYLIRKFNFHQEQIGNIYAYLGLMTVLVQSLLTRLVAKKWKEQIVLRFSIVSAGLGILLYLAAKESWQIYTIAPVFAVFGGLTMVNFVGLVSKSVGQEIQGEILGINSSIQALSQAGPPILAGVVAASSGPYLSLVVAGILMIFSGLIFYIFYQPPPHILHQP